MFLTVSKRRGHAIPLRTIWGSIRISQEAESEGKTWTGVFVVVASGRNMRGRVISRLRMD